MPAPSTIPYAVLPIMRLSFIHDLGTCQPICGVQNLMMFSSLSANTSAATPSTPTATGSVIAGTSPCSPRPISPSISASNEAPTAEPRVYIITRNTQSRTSLASFPRGKITRIMLSPQALDVLEAPTTRASPIATTKVAPLHNWGVPGTDVASHNPSTVINAVLPSRPSTHVFSSLGTEANALPSLFCTASRFAISSPNDTLCRAASSARSTLPGYRARLHPPSPALVRLPGWLRQQMDSCPCLHSARSARTRHWGPC